METNSRLCASVSEFLAAAGDGTGALVGAGVGGSVAGPPGAVLGAVLGGMSSRLVQKLGREFNQRVLSTREDLRVGSVLALADAEMKERLKRGETLREDGFFDFDESGRSGAEEVGEHILLKCQREPEERKLPYMANLLAAFAFQPSIDVQTAHYMVRIAEQLTYRQLCLIHLVSEKDKYKLRDTVIQNDEGYYAVDLYSILLDIQSLVEQGYLQDRVKFTHFQNRVPAELELESFMGFISYLMRLREIPQEDIEPLADRLS